MSNRSAATSKTCPDWNDLQPLRISPVPPPGRAAFDLMSFERYNGWRCAYRDDVCRDMKGIGHEIQKGRSSYHHWRACLFGSLHLCAGGSPVADPVGAGQVLPNRPGGASPSGGRRGGAAGLCPVDVTLLASARLRSLGPRPGAGSEGVALPRKLLHGRALRSRARLVSGRAEESHRPLPRPCPEPAPAPYALSHRTNGLNETPGSERRPPCQRSARPVMREGSYRRHYRFLSPKFLVGQPRGLRNECRREGRSVRIMVTLSLINRTARRIRRGFSLTSVAALLIWRKWGALHPRPCSAEGVWGPSYLR